MPNRRSAWIQSIPLARVVLGAVGASAVAMFTTLWLVLVPTFDERNRTTVSGSVNSVELIEFERAKPELDFTIASESSRFRINSGVFRDVFQSRPPAVLTVGVCCTAIVPTDEYREAVALRPGQSPTVYVDALTVGGKDVLTLTQSRTWHDRNRRIAMYLVAAFLLGAALLTTMAIVRIRFSRLASKPPNGD